MKTTIKRRFGTELLKAEIRLDDECGNGHDDFTITGAYWSSAPYRKDDPERCGAIGDFIASKIPELEIFNELHLSDWTGAPMYAIENGLYHIKNNPSKIVKEHFRCTDTELETLLTAEDQKHLNYLVTSLGLPDRWKQQAAKAIKMLEEYTGTTYTPREGMKSRYAPMSAEEMKEFKAKFIDVGYYTPEALRGRKEERQKKEQEARIQQVIQEADKKIEEIRRKKAVDLAVLNTGHDSKNFLYYTHSNELVFNAWDYQDRVTREEFDRVVAELDWKALPKEMKIKFDKQD